MGTPLIADEYTAQQRAGIAVYWLLMHGPMRAVDLARRLGYSKQDAWHLLNNLAGLHELPLYNDRGWWHVGNQDMRAVQEAQAIIERQMDESQGAAFCRPLSRRDVERIRQALRLLETTIKPATP